MRARIRAATARDLEQTYDVWREAETAAASGAEAPPSRSQTSLHQHEMETGDMFVAESGGRIIGFAAAITRGRIRFLAELYVRPEHRSEGLGRRLLERALPPHDNTVDATLSSDDPRAVGLYVRHGMQPNWPYFYLLGQRGGLRDVEECGTQIVRAEAGDPNLINWDRGICGRERSQDHSYWVNGAAAVALWFRREGRTAGYGYVQMRSEESIWYPDAATIGPVGARTIEEARMCALAAVAWARERASVLRIGVPGPHPALAPLLEAGFRITDTDIFVCRGSGMFADPRRYIPSGGALF